jgi:hypothetical protein
MTMPQRISNSLIISGLAMLVVGLIGLFSPWTRDIYIALFPVEKFAYVNDPKGGPYPELGFLFLIFPGLLLALLGLAFRPSKKEGNLPIL